MCLVTRLLRLSPCCNFTRVLPDHRRHDFSLLEQSCCPPSWSTNPLATYACSPYATWSVCRAWKHELRLKPGCDSELLETACLPAPAPAKHSSTSHTHRLPRAPDPDKRQRLTHAQTRELTCRHTQTHALDSTRASTIRDHIMSLCLPPGHGKRSRCKANRVCHCQPCWEAAQDTAWSVCDDS